MNIGPILTPLPYSQEREERRAATNAALRAAEVLIATAVDEYWAGRPHQHLLDEAIAVCDAEAGLKAAHRIVTNRLFALGIARKRRT